MRYTIDYLRLPHTDKQLKSASRAIQSACRLSKSYSDGIVDRIVSGGKETLALQPGTHLDSIKKLGKYFVLSKPITGQRPITKNPIDPAGVGGMTVKQKVMSKHTRKSPTQLKLWEVTYTLRGQAADHIALVLADNEALARQAIVKKLTVFGAVARELTPPFKNGQVLTTKISSI